MSWEDRARRGAYTSPSGVRIEFDFVQVSRETPKRTTAFEFPGLDGAYVQDNGFGARQYPLQCYFSGPDCDLEATQFEAALLERGVGRLEHPLYGTFDVVPYEAVARRDDLVSSANQAIVEVTFWTSIRELYPSSGVSSVNEIVALSDGFAMAAATQFEGAADLSSVVLQEDLGANYGGILQAVGGTLTAVATGTASTQARFNAARQAAISGTDALITSPLTLGFQMAELIALPARDARDFAAMADGYSALLDNLLTSAAALPWLLSVPAGSRAEKSRANAFLCTDLAVSSVVMALGVAGLSATYQTRGEAVQAADVILGAFDTVAAWREAGFDTIGVVDTGESYAALRELTASVAGFLLNLSFSLLAERRAVLSRPRALLELCAELYGSVDDRLDLLIASNNILPGEILELPRGRTVIWYA